MPSFGQDPAQQRAKLSGQIDVESERRLQSGFHFNGYVFQFGDRSQRNIQGFASSAMAAMTLDNADPADTHWSGGEAPDQFFDRENVPVTMSAATAVKFGQAAAAWKAKHIFAARALKDMTTIPKNYDSDAYWPVNQALTNGG